MTSSQSIGSISGRCPMYSVYIYRTHWRQNTLNFKVNDLVCRVNVTHSYYYYCPCRSSLMEKRKGNQQTA
uniref:Putative secreted protein n=1 Tax=Ixodes ricinus TaxID=34613 RepID=A0A0K8R7S8_IXORI